uniref:VP2 n=1 Tax=Pink-eared duck calicivirus I TaxID=2592509 RepID=A0A5B8KA78_9CALI|nr:VP2 [Pink-eared duck calicivirus I]
MATAATALLGAGSQAATSVFGIANSIGDLVYRGKELALAQEALKQQVAYNNKSLALAAAQPFINAAASGAATKYVMQSRLDVARGLGASASTLAALAAGQQGVYVNGNFQPIHYADSMYNSVTNRTSRPMSFTGVNQVSFPATTINKTTTNNITKNFESSQPIIGRSAPSRNRLPDQWTFNSAASGITGHYSVNPSPSGSIRTSSPFNTMGSSSSTTSALNNWYQFGFLSPGGTRL